MTQFLGLVLVIALVFGALFYSTGPAVLAAVPIELGLIGGAALGALLIGNSFAVAKQALLGFPSGNLKRLKVNRQVRWYIRPKRACCTRSS